MSPSTSRCLQRGWVQFYFPNRGGLNLSGDALNCESECVFHTVSCCQSSFYDGQASIKPAHDLVDWECRGLNRIYGHYHNLIDISLSLVRVVDCLLGASNSKEQVLAAWYTFPLTRQVNTNCKLRRRVILCLP